MTTFTFINNNHDIFELVRNAYHLEYFCWEGEWVDLKELEERWGLFRVFEWNEFPRFLMEENVTPEEIDQLEFIWKKWTQIYDPDAREQEVQTYRDNGSEQQAQELEAYYSALSALGEQPDYARLFWLHDMLFKSIEKPEGKWWWECE